MLDLLLTWYHQTSAWELIAVASAVAYLLLAAHKSIWCWAAAGLSCAVYIGIMWQAQLYMQVLLNLVYLVMAGYGAWCWQRRSESPQSPAPPSAIFQPKRWQVQTLLLTGLLAVSLVIGLLLTWYTDASQPYLDAGLTVFSLYATYLLAQQAFSNWFYWLVIDSCYVWLFMQQQLIATAALYGLYVILIFYAMWQWRSESNSAEQACKNSG